MAENKKTTEQRLDQIEHRQKILFEMVDMFAVPEEFRQFAERWKNVQSDSQEKPQDKRIETIPFNTHISFSIRAKSFREADEKAERIKNLVEQIAKEEGFIIE